MNDSNCNMCNILHRFFFYRYTIFLHMSALKHIYLLRSRAIKMCSVVTLRYSKCCTREFWTLFCTSMFISRVLPSFAPYTHSDKNSKMKIKTLLPCMIANHICGLTAHLRESFLVSENVDNFMIANFFFLFFY